MHSILGLCMCVSFTLTVPSKDQDNSLVLAGELESSKKRLTCSLWPWNTLHSPDCHPHTYRVGKGYTKREKKSSIGWSILIQCPNPLYWLKACSLQSWRHLWDNHWQPDISGWVRFVFPKKKKIISQGQNQYSQGQNGHSNESFFSLNANMAQENPFK